MINNIKYVPRHISHHGSHSGYDKLFEHLALSTARNEILAWCARHIPHAIAWRLWGLRPQPTSMIGLEAELAAALWIARGESRLCHFIYGEDTYFWSPLWKSGRNKCVATFHYPPNRLLERVNPGSIRALDAAVIVGNNQREALARFLPPERIYHCPHPVDLHFFCPAPQPVKTELARIVCVGSLFRNYSELRMIHDRLRATGVLKYELHVCGLSDAQATLLSSSENIVIHKNISDQQLLELYQSATLGLLPLTDATANNAVLEMMACGLPLVVSNVGAIDDYVRGSAVRFFASGDMDAAIEHVTELLQSQDLITQEGNSNRDHAEIYFGMPTAAAAMMTIYNKIFNQ